MMSGAVVCGCWMREKKRRCWKLRDFHYGGADDELFIGNQKASGKLQATRRRRSFWGEGSWLVQVVWEDWGKIL
jgi:hypothetical protein